MTLQPLSTLPTNQNILSALNAAALSGGVSPLTPAQITTIATPKSLDSLGIDVKLPNGKDAQFCDLIARGVSTEDAIKLNIRTY